MRIRSTKPEFWRSERIARISWDARLVLKGLEHYVDDNGVGKDDIALIVGDVFPRDMCRRAPETLARVSEAISELASEGFLWRYAVEGTRLLFISWWDQLQRIDKPSKGRFPRPDGTTEFRQSEIRESVASPPETLAPGTGEQGNRGTGESGVELVGGSGGKGANPRGTRLPDDWTPLPEVVAQMRADHPHIDLQAETAKFLDYWHAKTGRDATKRDWPATWRNWIRRTAEQQPRAPTINGHPLQGADLRAAENEAFKRQLAIERNQP
jgi:hypothetical protein